MAAIDESDGKCGLESAGLGATGTVGRCISRACVASSIVEVVRLLIKSGADVNLNDPGYLGTPFHATFRASNNTPIVELLVESGADITAVHGRYGNAVGVAAFLSTEDMLKLALSKGVEAGVLDSMGRIPLHLAASAGKLESLKVLLDHGEDPALRDKTGRNALHWAAQSGSVACLKLILAKLGPSANINQPDRHGWTPLCWAARGCEKDQLEMLRALLDAGAQRSHVSDLPARPWTPASIALYESRPREVLELLNDGNFGDTLPKLPKNRRLAVHEHYLCRYCQYILSGIGHKCEDCYFQFNLCYKCYDLRDILHDPGHHFCELGPEFIEVSDGEAPNSPQQESPAEDSDSESDSDSSSSSSSSDSEQAPEQTSNVLASL
ncbi:ankyrin repeat protein [Apiospora arundinis]